MPVYCDLCTQPGRPNVDAGYTKNGGWLFPVHRQLELTCEEKRRHPESALHPAICALTGAALRSNPE